MIIGLTGPICSGKRTLAKYLIKYHGFYELDLLKYFKLMLEEKKSPEVLRKMKEEQTDEETASSTPQEEIKTPSCLSESDFVQTAAAMLEEIKEVEEEQLEDDFLFEYYMCKLLTTVLIIDYRGTQGLERQIDQGVLQRSHRPLAIQCSHLPTFLPRLNSNVLVIHTLPNALCLALATTSYCLRLTLL